MKNFASILGFVLVASSAFGANQWDNAQLQAIRAFLNPLAGGTYSLQGDLGCNQISIQKYNDQGDPYYEIVSASFGGASSFAGGSVLYSADITKSCDQISSTALHCTVSHVSENGGVFSSVRIVTEFTMTKNEEGQLAGFQISQNKLPALNLNCHN